MKREERREKSEAVGVGATTTQKHTDHRRTSFCHLFLIVGAGVLDCPRSYGSSPHHRLSSFLIVGTDVLGGPRSLRSQNALSSVAEKRNLQKPSPMEKVPRNEADEVS